MTCATCATCALLLYTYEYRIVFDILYDTTMLNKSKLATLHVLPYTMLGSLLVALLLSYVYSRFVARPIRQMAAVTTTMQVAF